MEWKNIKEQLIVFLKDEVKKAGLQRVTVGLSGGLDSAIVAILSKEAFGANMSCVLMPSHYSSEGSVSHALEVCKKFDIDYEIVEIAPMVEAHEKFMNGDKLRIGNFSARMRMSVLYDVSARDKSLVVGTSNKSEILLGYGTIFGDVACAINPIGEMYKSDEFEFAKLLGVVDSILTKAPSADLWEGQSDEDELGYSYKIMDDVLKEFIDNQKTKEALLLEGVDKTLIEMLENRVKSNAFKSQQAKIATINF